MLHAHHWTARYNARISLIGHLINMCTAGSGVPLHINVKNDIFIYTPSQSILVSNFLDRLLCTDSDPTKYGQMIFCCTKCMMHLFLISSPEPS